MATGEYTYYDERTKSDFVIYGEEIAHAESSRPNTPRHTRIKIYRTESGQYAVVTTGMSRIFHDGIAPCRTQSKNPRGTQATYADLADDAVPCPICKPADDGFLNDRVYMETNRSRVSVCKDLNEVYVALTGYDSTTNQRFMSNVGSSAWEQLRATEPAAQEHIIEVR